MKAYIDRLERTRDLTDAEFRALLEESAPAEGGDDTKTDGESGK